MAEKIKQKEKISRETNTLAGDKACCKVDAIVIIDGRGQIVLPKEVRDKAQVNAGDKFAVLSCESDGRVCCISLVKADDFADSIKDMLGPMLKGILQ